MITEPRCRFLSCSVSETGRDVQRTKPRPGVYKLALKMPDGSAWLITPAEGAVKPLFRRPTTPSAPTPRQGS